MPCCIKLKLFKHGNIQHAGSVGISPIISYVGSKKGRLIKINTPPGLGLQKVILL